MQWTTDEKKVRATARANESVMISRHLSLHGHSHHVIITNHVTGPQIRQGHQFSKNKDIKFSKNRAAPLASAKGLNERHMASGERLR